MNKDNFFALLFGILFVIGAISFVRYSIVIDSENQIATEYKVLNKVSDRSILIVQDRQFVLAKTVSKSDYNSAKINGNITITESKLTQAQLAKIASLGIAAMIAGIGLLLFLKKCNYI